jgi:hypothetical protein
VCSVYNSVWCIVMMSGVQYKYRSTHYHHQVGVDVYIIHICYTYAVHGVQYVVHTLYIEYSVQCVQ